LTQISNNNPKTEENNKNPKITDVHHGNYNPSCKAKTNVQEDND
jgi:hypothetical protein